MILFQNKGFLLFQLVGSVFLSKEVVCPALFSCVLLVVIIHYPYKPAEWGWDKPVGMKIFLAVIGYSLVIRVSKAYARFESGIVMAQKATSMWNDAFTCMQCYVDASLEAWVQRGDPKSAVTELQETRCKMLHWYSYLSSAAVTLLQSKEGGNPGLCEADRFDCTEGFVNRMNKGQEWWRHSPVVPSQAEDSHGSHNLIDKRHNRFATDEVHHGVTRRPNGLADSVHGLCVQKESWESPKLPVLGRLTEEELAILNSEDPINTICKWILFEVCESAAKGHLLLHPAIISRVLQQVSMGKLFLTHALKIATIPFPFPYAQVIDALLLPCWFILFPCMIHRAIVDKRETLHGSGSWSDLTLWEMYIAIPLNYFCCAGLASINHVARELEEPFGFDSNDYPVHLPTSMAIRSVEDCNYTHLPHDVNGIAEGFGHRTVQALASVRSMIEKREASKKRMDIDSAFDALTEDVRRCSSWVGGMVGERRTDAIPQAESLRKVTRLLDPDRELLLEPL